MGHLDKLNITNRVVPAAKPRRKMETVEYRREKLIANIEEQIELANLAVAGKPLVLNRKRGHQVKVVRPRLWWKASPEGTVYTEIRYNKVALNLAGRGISIAVKNLKALPAALRTVIRAVKAGELDGPILNAARKSRGR